MYGARIGYWIASRRISPVPAEHVVDAVDEQGDEVHEGDVVEREHRVRAEPRKRRR